MRRRRVRRKPATGAATRWAGALLRKKIFLISAVTITIAAVITAGAGLLLKETPNGPAGEVRGVWLAYVDFKELGFFNKEKEEFEKNARIFFADAAEKGINTVYFHVRAFRDASYLSEQFPISCYLWDKKQPISYDPLEIMVKEAHRQKISLHAWMNPYRNRDFDQKILNPASQQSIEEILDCVEEVITGYDVDGIHFDDYFYPEKGYKKVSQEERMKNVNRMVRMVYRKVKALDETVEFGISPAGNIGYAQSIGADIKTWLSEPGYVDYIVPQIYWTDKHSASWRERMYTETLEEWIALNEAGIPLYVGLALYRAGEKASDDPGWQEDDDNLVRQLKLLREKGCAGYVLFSAGDFDTKRAQKELQRFQREVMKGIQEEEES